MWTGDLVHYTNEQDLFEWISQSAKRKIFPSQLRLIDEENVLECDRNLGVTSYGFIDDRPRVQISLEMLEQAVESMSWVDVVNESLLRLAIEHLPPFATFFTNPHPIVLEHLKTLPNEALTDELFECVSTNPSAEVVEWMFQHHPDRVDWSAMCSNTNPVNMDILWTHINETQYIFEEEEFDRFIATANTPDTVDYAVMCDGGIENAMASVLFIQNNSTVANNVKKAWLRSQVRGSKKNIMDMILLVSRDDELIRMVMENIGHIPDSGCFWNNPSNEMADHIIQYISDDLDHKEDTYDTYVKKTTISLNSNPRVVECLLKHPSIITFPEFLSQDHPDAVEYSLEWLKKNYDRIFSLPSTNEPVFVEDEQDMSEQKECAQFAGSNKNIDMVMALYHKFPKLISISWLESLGKLQDVVVYI